MPDRSTLDTFLRNQAQQLRSKDTAPTSLAAWQTRRQNLRRQLMTALGPAPGKPGNLSAQIVGTLQREGYRIEKILLETFPDMWMSATAYVPKATGKVPAVLCVHGHWRGARRDPAVQARCLGLVKLGFFVLVVDAFGAGERHPVVQQGGYHGALQGSTLWPAGLTLLGVQVHENRRAVDYLLSRPEVDGSRLGLTGASGGGNQSLYAGALDERFEAVVPVCSVGTYQAYLRAACCVCEVLPGALRFTEEGDVLGLIAPRALMVINASRDAFQFSIGEAKKSLERAGKIYELYGKSEKVRHTTFESGHDYSQPMREAMYGWMTRWLKNEGTGQPIPEPAHTVEKPEDLACYPQGKRPTTFLFPATLANRVGRQLLAWQDDRSLDHVEAWQSRAVLMRGRLEEVLGGMPAAVPPKPTWEAAKEAEGLRRRTVTLTPEPGLTIQAELRDRPGKRRQSIALVLHLDGATAAWKHPATEGLLRSGWAVVVPELRGTGTCQPAGDAIAGAPDHNSCEHALWIGRPLLGQWVVDVRGLLDSLLDLPELDRRVAVVGLGQAGLVAIVAGALLDDSIRSVGLVDSPCSLLSEQAYPAGTRMGLLAPGLLSAGDVPHLAALLGPRPLAVCGGVAATGKPLLGDELQQAFAFTRKVYRWLGQPDRLQFRKSSEASQLSALVLPR